MTQTIQINDKIQLTEFRETDKLQLVEYLNNREHFEYTLMIPHPYTEASADWWINNCRESAEKHGRVVNFAIRNTEGVLLGGIGRGMTTSMAGNHKDEIGYWVAKPFWGQGIATAAVRGFVDYWFNNSDLIRIEAHVFATNIASCRALEKVGYMREGFCEKYYYKSLNGKFLDAWQFAILKETA